MDFTYYNCITYGGLLAITAAVLFWLLVAASITTAFGRKYVTTHCLLAAAWAITLAICWVFTRRMMGAILGTVPCECFSNRSPIMIMAFNLESALIVPLWHLIGSMVAVVLWILIRPRTFAKPITISLLVVLLFAGLFDYGVRDTVRAWKEMNVRSIEGARKSRQSNSASPLERMKSLELARKEMEARLAASELPPRKVTVCSNGYYHVDLRGPDVHDLAPLRDLPIYALSIGRVSPHSSPTAPDDQPPPLTDLSPISDLPLLRSLDLSGSQVTDLSPLRGCQLEKLVLYRTGVSDISPLQSMPLKSLYLAGTKVSDIAPLEGMPLQHLTLDNTPVSNINALQEMPLEFLGISFTHVEDLSPLKGMPLKELRIARSKVKDLSPLAGMQLNSLILSHTFPGSYKRRKWDEIPTTNRYSRGIDGIRNMESLQTIDNIPAEEFWRRFDRKQFPQ